MAKAGSIVWRDLPPQWLLYIAVDSSPDTD